MAKKLSIWSSFFIDLSPRDMVLELEKNQLHFCELSDEHGLQLLNEDGDEKITGREFRQYAISHGVSFSQGHLWLGVRICDTDRDVLSVLKRWINLYEAIGIKNMVLHCDSLESHPEYSTIQKLNKNAEVLNKLVPFLKNRNITICLENLINDFSSAEDLLYIISKLDSDENFGICLDTGHLNLADGHQKEFIDSASYRLKAIHLADNAGSSDQHLMPFSVGNVNFMEVAHELDVIGYQGIYNYEVPGERNCPIEIREMKVAYLKSVSRFLFGEIK